MLKGEMKGFVGLGGNFVRAIPDTGQMEPAWRTQRLTVQIATKLNRSHLDATGEVCLSPALPQPHRDGTMQATGAQTVAVEDSSSMIHASFGDRKPAGPNLRSEPDIVAGIAQATLAPNPKVDWRKWVGDYSLVRDAIEATYPQWFKGFNARFHEAGGFHRPNKALERDFSEAPGGHANFFKPTSLSAIGFDDAAEEVLRLITLRSNDQFNTTVYGYEDRFRGVSGTRDVLFVNVADMQRLGLDEGQTVGLETVAVDGVKRALGGLRVTRYDIPVGCIGAYYPEANVLVPVGHHAEGSKTPASKSVPVRIVV